MLHENYVYYPEQLTGEELDIFLEKGWYRMGQSIFTTHFIILNETIYRVYWLRYDLRKIKPSNETKRIIKLNRGFDSCIKPFELTDELESLFTLYKTAIDFEPAQSIRFWLHGDQPVNVFDTEIVEIRDNGKLIAAGIFDKGNQSIAGILNFYHPDYKKYSLGKYLMLLKIHYALSNEKTIYYPGYIVKDYPRFDYKLFVDPDSAEIYLPETGQWVLFKDAFQNEEPYQVKDTQ
jgi:arginyl-tRNA--protein-N-Asp/Glu arginylyltransferase